MLAETLGLLFSAGHVEPLHRVLACLVSVAVPHDGLSGFCSLLSITVMFWSVRLPVQEWRQKQTQNLGSLLSSVNSYSTKDHSGIT